MAQQQIITKPYVGELQDDDSLFINHDGALRQVKKKDADLASSEEVAAETAAREAFEAREVAAREAYEAAETAAREAFEADIEGQMSEKANVDGYYEEMTVGDAEQLVATQFVEDNEPYLFRPTGGSSDVGNRAYLDKIVGSTVEWNQLSKETQGSYTHNGIAYQAADGVFTVNGTATDVSYNKITSNTQRNHVYYMGISGSSDVYVWLLGYSIKKTNTERVIKEDSVNQFGLIVSEGVTVNNAKVIPQVIDLTAMFGATIADYIYNLEQSSAGAGVAWFRKLFPKDYYEYNAGELLSVEGLESHDTVGFNQFDKNDSANWKNWYIYSGGKIVSGTAFKSAVLPCLPNTTYYACKETGTCLFLASFPSYPSVGDIATVYQGNNIGKETNLTTGLNDHYLVVWFYNQNADGTNYQAIADTLNINISNPSRNGEYEEYIKHSYPLDNSLTLRGMPRLDSFNNLYYDGDTYASDGTVTRKRHKVVFDGSFTISQSLARDNTMRVYWASGSFATGANAMKPNGGNDITIVSDITVYPPDYIYREDVEGISENKHTNEAGIWIGINKSKLSAETVAGVNAYLAQHPITVEYELATPTTEEAEPYQYTQIVDDLGTEEFVSNGFIPAGHLTEYPANLRDKLQHLPDLAGMDGTYLIRQTGNQMSLVYMPAVFPEIPTEDGTYTLETVVTGGVATLQWVAE